MPEERSSNWRQAVAQLHLEGRCPACGEERLVDRNELGWHCSCCGTSWGGPLRPPVQKERLV